MDGYQRRTLGKKVNIIQAAVDRLGDSPEQITIAQLAADANVSPVSIYNYFGSKEALLQLAVLSFTKQQLSRARVILHGELPFPTKVQQLLTWQSASLSLIHPRMLPYLMDSDDGFANRLGQMNEQGASTLLESLLQQGRDHGHIRPDMTDENVMNYFQLISYALTRPDVLAGLNTQPDGNPYSPFIEQMMHLFFYGFMERNA